MTGRRTRRSLGLLLVVATVVLAGHRGASAFTASPPRPVEGLRTSWEEWQLRFEESLKREPGLVYAGRTTDKVVALTVDDGPDSRFTPSVLAILEAEKVPATFFVVGRNVALYPELVRQEVRDGDEVGNHTYSHPELARLAPGTLAQELDEAEAEIEAVTGRKTLYFRPPKGYLDRRSFQVAQAAGYKVILWSVALEHHDLLTPQAMADRVIRLTGPGSIILLHDGRLDRTKSVEALPLLIRGLKRRGYRFVTVSRLLNLRRAEPRRFVPPPEGHWAR